jgi:hypothetical protein
MNPHTPGLVRSAVLVCVLVAAPLVARAEEDDFVPPSGSLPAQRTGGASRGSSSEAAAATVSILAPADAVGLTSREQPVIYWYLSADTTKPITLTVNDLKQRENPLVETALPGPTKAGVHAFDLSKVKSADGKPVKLQPGGSYEVVAEVAVKDAGASENPSATCRIQRLDPKDAPAGAEKEADLAKRAAAYGKAGIWFDYIDALNAAIAAKPNDEALLEKRAKALATQRLTWKPDGTITEQRKADAGGAGAKP